MLSVAALATSSGRSWASLSLSQHPDNVPPAVFLPQSLDLKQLTYPSNKIVSADQAWHFLCTGRDGMPYWLCWYFSVFFSHFQS